MHRSAQTESEYVAKHHRGTRQRFPSTRASVAINHLVLNPRLLYSLFHPTLCFACIIPTYFRVCCTFHIVRFAFVHTKEGSVSVAIGNVPTALVLISIQGTAGWNWPATGHRSRYHPLKRVPRVLHRRTSIRVRLPGRHQGYRTWKGRMDPHQRFKITAASRPAREQWEEPTANPTS